MKAREIIRDCGLTVAQLARDTGLSDEALRAWLKGKRTPAPESLERLAAGLRKRGDRLQRMADVLQRSARTDRE